MLLSGEFLNISMNVTLITVLKILSEDILMIHMIWMENLHFPNVLNFENALL